MDNININDINKHFNKDFNEDFNKDIIKNKFLISNENLFMENREPPPVIRQINIKESDNDPYIITSNKPPPLTRQLNIELKNKLHTI